MEKRYGLISIIIPSLQVWRVLSELEFLKCIVFAVWLFALFCMPNCWGQIAMSPFSRSLHQPSWTRCWSGVAVEPSGFCAQTGSGSWDRSLFARSQAGKLAPLFCIVSNRIIVCICILPVSWWTSIDLRYQLGAQLGGNPSDTKVANTNFT